LSRVDRSLVTPQGGGMSLKVIISAGTIIGLIYMGFKVVPPTFNNYELRDEVRTAGRNATYNGTDEERVRTDVLKRARSCGVELDPKQILIDKSTEGVHISVSYDVPIDIPLHPFVLHFEADSQEGT
jgi:hypothetical protein